MTLSSGQPPSMSLERINLEGAMTLSIRWLDLWVLLKEASIAASALFAREPFTQRRSMQWR